MRYAKAIAALVGGLTPAAVMGFLALFGVSVPQEVITKVLATVSVAGASIGVAVAPANKEKGEQSSAQPINLMSDPAHYAVADTSERETIDIPKV